MTNALPNDDKTQTLDFVTPLQYCFISMASAIRFLFGVSAKPQLLEAIQ